jgi:hypothetical protein
MHHIVLELPKKQADGYMLPLGPVSIVSAVTDVGMIGCGPLMSVL